MAKCPECGRRKGKRLCPARDAHICSLCCGSLRKADMCGDCTFFKPPARDYNNLPRYLLSDMAASERLQQISFPIESGICEIDRSLGFELRDAQVIEIFELLLDRYAFDDPPESLADRIRMLHCEGLVERLERELKPYLSEEVVKILGAVRASARRRAGHGRNHLDYLHASIRA